MYIYNSSSFHSINGRIYYVLDHVGLVSFSRGNHEIAMTLLEHHRSPVKSPDILSVDRLLQSRHPAIF